MNTFLFTEYINYMLLRKKTFKGEKTLQSLKCTEVKETKQNRKCFGHIGTSCSDTQTYGFYHLLYCQAEWINTSDCMFDPLYASHTHSTEQ